MSGPLIAVSAAAEELPTAFGPMDCTKLNAVYTDAVYAAGGRPVILPVVANPPSGLLEGLDGLMLTGGGDLSPALYGQPADPSVYGVRADRDTFESALYQEALERQLPVFAICRGMQLVNVLRGGDLVQELADGGRHWQQAPSHQTAHGIEVTVGSRLADIFDTSGVRVNSYHHQALRRLGAGLEVTARCGDVIEAVEAVDTDLMGVQWHPEHMATSDDLQRALFEAFVARAASRAASLHIEEMI